MNLFPDVVPVIIFGNYLVVYTCKPRLPSSGFRKTDLKLKVYQLLLSKYLPTEKPQILSCHWAVG
jgi:hypothetical protein